LFCLIESLLVLQLIWLSGSKVEADALLIVLLVSALASSESNDSVLVLTTSLNSLCFGDSDSYGAAYKNASLIF